MPGYLPKKLIIKRILSPGNPATPLKTKGTINKHFKMYDLLNPLHTYIPIFPILLITRNTE